MNILLTSVGRRSYIVKYFVEALSKRGRVVVCNSIHTSAFNYADVGVITPLIYDEKYIHSVLDICKAESISAIISLFDIDLLVLAKNRHLFERLGIKFIGPTIECASVANDKIKTRDFFASQNINTPYTLDSLDEARKLLSVGAINFPVVVKPRWGMGSIGVYKALSLDELDVLYARCRMDVCNSYLSYESRSEIDKSVLIQEWASGDEYGIDVFNDLNFGFCGIIAKKKIAMRSGETDIGETVSAVPFMHVANKLSKSLGFTGILSFDCFFDGNKVTGIEINPRISGHYPFSHLAGARYPEQIIEWLFGNPTDPKLLSAELGVRGCKELLPVKL